MRKKILATSILTIALCLSIIAGSTFALFTSKTTLDASVTSGDVTLAASIESYIIESIKPDDNGSIVDEKGHKYSYEDRSSYGTFTNGGTATVTASTVDLDDITPGDKITLTLQGTNTSSVAALTRFTIKCMNDDGLMKGLKFTINGVVYEGISAYESVWSTLAKGSDMAEVTISIELPAAADDQYENKTSTIVILVEAVQSNANVGPNLEPGVTYYS